MNTPRTDANDLGWQFNEQYGDFDSLSDTPMPWLDFAKMLEIELFKVTDQRDRLAVASKSLLRHIKQIRSGDSPLVHPLLIESMDKSAAKLDEALQSLTTNEQ